MNTGQNWSEWITANSDPKDAHAKREALDDIIVLDLSSKSYAAVIVRLYWPNLVPR